MRQSIGIPGFLRTDSGGSNQRIRVDVAQTSFFAGREFRTFREWATATTGSFVIKAVVPLNIILHELNVQCDAGSVRIETMVGGTEGGTFNDALPIFPTNAMTEKPQPAYVNQTTLHGGGTHTGGTTLDVLRAKTSDNSNFSGSVGAGLAERGVAANTYYFRMTLTGFEGVFRARWEERP